MEVFNTSLCEVINFSDLLHLLRGTLFSHFAARRQFGQAIIVCAIVFISCANESVHPTKRKLVWDELPYGFCAIVSLSLNLYQWSGHHSSRWWIAYEDKYTMTSSTLCVLLCEYYSCCALALGTCSVSCVLCVHMQRRRGNRGKMFAWHGLFRVRIAYCYLGFYRSYCIYLQLQSADFTLRWFYKEFTNFLWSV